AFANSIQSNNGGRPSSDQRKPTAGDTKLFEIYRFTSSLIRLAIACSIIPGTTRSATCRTNSSEICEAASRAMIDKLWRNLADVLRRIFALNRRFSLIEFSYGQFKQVA